MNMQIILRQIDTDDFGKMLKACKSSRERFYLEAARINPNFEYHIDLPGPDGPQTRGYGNVARRSKKVP